MALGVQKFFQNVNVSLFIISKIEINPSPAVSCPVPVNPPFGRVMYNSVTYNSLIRFFIKILMRVLFVCLETSEHLKVKTSKHSNL